jgi:hypothetical protein
MDYALAKSDQTESHAAVTDFKKYDSALGRRNRKGVSGRA